MVRGRRVTSVVRRLTRSSLAGDVKKETITEEKKEREDDDKKSGPVEEKEKEEEEKEEENEEEEAVGGSGEHSQHAVEHAAAMASQLFSVSANSSMVEELGDVRNTKDVKRGRKKKFTPEERMLLVELYHDHFAIYHSNRYLGPEYATVEGNLKQWLLKDWSRKISALGIERSSFDIANRLNELFAEAGEARKRMHDPDFSHQVAAYRMSPVFQLIDRVFDYSKMTHPEIEKVLDKYEMKLCRDKDETIFAEVSERKRKQWTLAEKEILVEQYIKNANIYNMLPIRKVAGEVRDSLLNSWAELISEQGVAERDAAEVHAKLEYYRALVEPSMIEEAKSFEPAAPRKRGRPSLKKRGVSPTTLAIAAASGCTSQLGSSNGEEGDIQIDDVDYMDRDTVLRQCKKIQENLIRTMVITPEMRRELSGTSSSPSCSGQEAVLPLMEYMPTRINRPHMSRAERHLLGLLYRKDYKTFEQYNNPHIARKTPTNKKWKLLEEWADKLTQIGVSIRGPDELATKISQFKHTVRNHKICQTEGVGAVTFSNEYKMRRCLRPLSPTTRLFDTSDESIPWETYNEQAIENFIEEATESRKYPGSEMHEVRTNGMANRTTMPFSVLAHKRELEFKELYEAMTGSHRPLVVDGEVGGPLKKAKREVEDEGWSKEGGGGGEADENERHDSSRTSSSEDKDVSSLTLEQVLMGVLPGTMEDEHDSYEKTYMGIHQGLDELEKNPSGSLLYDAVDMSGHIMRIAITREETNRDINYYLWSRYIDFDLTEPLSMFVCAMCDQMATSSTQVPQQKRNALLSMMPHQHLMAQQALPSMAIASDGRLVAMTWMRGAPRHRCVAFLRSTVCEKIAEISHSVIRHLPCQV